MPKHQRNDIDYADQTVIVEKWSGKIFRFEKRWHSWQFVDQAASDKERKSHVSPEG